jgi:hypothetical protein
LLKLQRLPRCWSSTTSLPFFRPISLRFCPSSPLKLRLSSQFNPAKSVPGVLRPSGITGAAAVWDSPDGDIGCEGAMPDGDGGVDGRADATPVASGLALSPAETVTCPSGVIRTASSASTRLRLSARSCPVNSAMPDSLTSAFGALATIT